MLSMFKDKKGFSALFTAQATSARSVPILHERPSRLSAPNHPTLRVPTSETEASRTLRCQRCWRTFFVDAAAPREEMVCRVCDYPACPRCRVWEDAATLSATPHVDDVAQWRCCTCAQPMTLMRLFDSTRYGTQLVVHVIEYCDARSARILKSFFPSAAHPRDSPTRLSSPTAIAIERPSRRSTTLQQPLFAPWPTADVEKENADAEARRTVAAVPVTKPCTVDADVTSAAPTPHMGDVAALRVRSPSANNACVKPAAFSTTTTTPPDPQREGEELRVSASSGATASSTSPTRPAEPAVHFARQVTAAPCTVAVDAHDDDDDPRPLPRTSDGPTAVPPPGREHSTKSSRSASPAPRFPTFTEFLGQHATAPAPPPPHDSPSHRRTGLVTVSPESDDVVELTGPRCSARVVAAAATTPPSSKKSIAATPRPTTRTSRASSSARRTPVTAYMLSARRLSAAHAPRLTPSAAVASASPTPRGTRQQSGVRLSFGDAATTTTRRRSVRDGSARPVVANTTSRLVRKPSTTFIRLASRTNNSNAAPPTGRRMGHTPCATTPRLARTPSSFTHPFAAPTPTRRPTPRSAGARTPIVTPRPPILPLSPATRGATSGAPVTAPSRSTLAPRPRTAAPDTLMRLRSGYVHAGPTFARTATAAPVRVLRRTHSATVLTRSRTEVPAGLRLARTRSTHAALPRPRPAVPREATASVFARLATPTRRAAPPPAVPPQRPAARVLTRTPSSTRLRPDPARAVDTCRSVVVHVTRARAVAPQHTVVCGTTAAASQGGSNRSSSSHVTGVPHYQAPLARGAPRLGETRPVAARTPATRAAVSSGAGTARLQRQASSFAPLMQRFARTDR